MIWECAPMEGVTGDLFRQAQARHFDRADRYYTPFLSATETRTLAAREMRELEPSHNAGLNVIPQLMGHDPDDFNWMAGAIRDLGYTEVNLNLGCPSATVTAKKKGAGLLGERALLERMLDGIFAGSPLPVSIKTRLGCESAEEFPALVELYNRYPVKELIDTTRRSLLSAATSASFCSGSSHRSALVSTATGTAPPDTAMAAYRAIRFTLKSWFRDVIMKT